jgi:hypothetical protein
MFEWISELLSAFAAVASVLIAAKVYYDSRKGPDIEFISKDYRVAKELGSAGSLSGRPKLLFMNSGEKAGSLLSILFQPSAISNPQGELTISVSLPQNQTFPITMQPYTSIMIEAPFRIKGNPASAFFQAAQNSVAIDFEYEVTAKTRTENKMGRFVIRLD